MTTYLINKINKIYEDAVSDRTKNFYDTIELGSSSAIKSELFRKLASIADSKGLKLTAEIGLYDPISKVVHVDVDNEDPIDSVFAMLDLDSLMDLPIRTITIDDIAKAEERKGQFIEKPEDVNDYTLTAVMEYDKNKDTTSKEIIQFLNTALDIHKISVSAIGRDEKENSYVYKYKLYAPKEFDLAQIRELIQSNAQLMSKLGVKTLDISEG